METPQIYETIQQLVLVLVWPKADLTDLSRLVGAENVVKTRANTIEVRNADEQWVTLHPGWAVAVIDGYGYPQRRHILSPSALTDWLRLKQ